MNAKTTVLEHLFELISVLSQSERRYLKIQIAYKREEVFRRFEKLLKLIYAYQGEKNFEELKNELVKIRIEENNLYELYDFTLLSMRICHRGRGVDTQIKEALTDARFLFENRLYLQSQKLLAKAKKKALAFDRWLSLLEILQIERSLYKEKETRGVELLLKNNEEETFRVSQLQQRQFRMQLLRDELFKLARYQDKPRAQEAEEKFRNILSDPLICEADAGRPFSELNTKYVILALYYRLHKDFKQALQYYKAQLGLWEEHPGWIREERAAFIKLLANYINTCIDQKAFKEIPSLLAKMRAVDCRSAEEEAEQFQNIAHIEILYLMNAGLWHKTDELIRNVEQGMETYRTKINKAREITFYYNIAVIYFFRQKFRLSLEWLNRIIQDKKTDHRQDVQRFARLLLLILHFELGKHDLLEYEFISTERYLRQRKSWTPYESMVVRHLKKLLDCDQGTGNEQFLEFQRQLQEFAGTNPAQLGLEELLCWSSHHLENRPMTELVLERQG